MTGSVLLHLALAIFLLTRLSRGVTGSVLLHLALAIFLLTRLSRGVTERLLCFQRLHRISTHTPLARRDGIQALTDEIEMNFYSHASREA